MSFNYKKHSIVGTESPIITKGARVGVQINHLTVIRDVPAYSIAVPDSNGRYIPVIEIGKVESASGTAITLDSAAQATKVDPTSDTTTDPLNKYWLTANGGAQTITYFDVTGGTAESPFQDGEVYDESKAVASVSTAVITLSGAFSDDPADEDIILPGGCDSANIWQEAVILTREITAEECEEKQEDFYVEAYSFGTILALDRLPADVKQLYDWGVIPTYGTKNLTIDIDK